MMKNHIEKLVIMIFILMNSLLLVMVQANVDPHFPLPILSIDSVLFLHPIEYIKTKFNEANVSKLITEKFNEAKKTSSQDPHGKSFEECLNELLDEEIYKIFGASEYKEGKLNGKEMNAVVHIIRVKAEMHCIGEKWRSTTKYRRRDKKECFEQHYKEQLDKFASEIQKYRDADLEKVKGLGDTGYNNTRNWFCSIGDLM